MMAAWRRSRFSADFRVFFSAQAVSTLGSSLTQFVLPLIVYARTGSAIALGAATAFTFLPYLILGLPAGAIADRVDRKRLTIGADGLRAAGIGLLGVLVLVDAAALAIIYMIAFVQTTLRIFYDAARHAAVARLVDKELLVPANGRLQAANSAMTVLGPFLAAAVLGVVSPAALLIADAATFLVSAVLISRIRRPFQADTSHTGDGSRDITRSPLTRGLRRDVVDGLRFVWRHPVLRSVSIMMLIVNLLKQPIYSQLVLFASVRLSATAQQIALLYTAGSAGVVLLSLTAGWLRRRFSFAQVALGALIGDGLLTAALALSQSYLVVMPLWAVSSGLAILFNINTNSLRQTVSPDAMLGRVMTVSMVLAWAAVPVASMLGSLAVAATGRIDLVYLTLGLASAATAFAFIWSPIGRDRDQAGSAAPISSSNRRAKSRTRRASSTPS